MRIMILALAVSATGCKTVECGTGTIEMAGMCAPATVTTGTAACGPFTVLQGDQCVAMFPPTVCDPTTTTPDLDPATGVTTCIGTGGGGCAAPFACPVPTDSTKQTICGQLYNLEDNAPFAATGATGAKCAAGATTGPCALQIQAYDAIAYAMSPSTATPLPTSPVYVDDCGRYRVPDITVPSGPFIGLGLDDAAVADMGPGGLTVQVGVATPKAPGTATKDLEDWIVKQSTTTMWSTSGGPPLSGGIYTAIFRTHKLGNGDPFATQSGVQFTKSGSPIPANSFYFTASQVTHQTIDATATVTGANGSVLVTNASVNDSLVYSGSGGITDPTTCKWETHAAASLPNIVFIQVYRPLNQLGKQCAQ